MRPAAPDRAPSLRLGLGLRLPEPAPPEPGRRWLPTWVLVVLCAVDAALGDLAHVIALAVVVVGTLFVLAISSASRHDSS